MIAAVLVVVVAACGGDDADSEATTTGAAGSVVSIADFSFSPPSLTVPVGATVTWTNNSEGGFAHTSTGADEVWASGSIEAGAEFSQTFDTPGTFAYMCSIHPSMTGEIVVEG